MSLGAWGMKAWILLEALPTSAGLDPCASIFSFPQFERFRKQVVVCFVCICCCYHFGCSFSNSINASSSNYLSKCGCPRWSSKPIWETLIYICIYIYIFLIFFLYISYILPICIYSPYIPHSYPLKGAVMYICIYMCVSQIGLLDHRGHTHLLK